MKLTLTQISNGVVLTTPEGSTAYTFDKGNLEGLMALLFDINNEIGLPGSKHDEQRITIKVEHGSDWKCKGCSICDE